ncbi:MAG: 2-C-methyl-D-erythritol 4-phosphate cytidylyltransferase [Bacteroidota bacterium]
MKRYAIIVAGGSGRRMQVSDTLSQLAKQFISIGGKPILMHTIERFAAPSQGSLFGTPTIVVLPEKDFPTWERLCREHHFHIPVQLVAGGNTRFQSVKNGLAAIKGDGLVAIHDGVRPFVSSDIIERSFQVAAEKGTAVAAVPLKDSVRLVEASSNRALDRSQLRLIQTPQTFQLSLIQQAFQVEESPNFTDDASVAERAGFPIYLIDGSYENIKITTPEDLLWAEAFTMNNEQ